MPVTVFVAPGPEVTSTTPGRPDTRRIPLGHMGRALFVSDQDVAQGRILNQSVIGRQDGPTRVAEDGIHAFSQQAFDGDLRTGHCCHDMPRLQSQSKRLYGGYGKTQGSMER